MILINYLIVCLIFGTTFLAIKIGVDHAVPPFFSAGIRFLAAGAILFLWMVWRKKADFALLLRKEMLVTGGLLTFGTFSFLYWAEQYVTSGIAAVLSATGPLMILLMQMIVLRQKATRRAVLGIIIGFAGVMLLVLPNLTSVQDESRWVIGCAAILTGEVLYSIGALYTKRVTQSYAEVSPIALNAAQMIYGGLLLLILSGFTERVTAEDLLQPSALGSLLYLTVVGSMVGHSLFYWLVAKTNPVFPSTWLYVSPLIAMTIGVLFYGETAGWFAVLGGITIIAGTVLTNLDSLRQLFRRSARLTSGAAGGPGAVGQKVR
ncbi:EamA family transporter [Paenibacillus sp. DXFW5]|uniref:EamA family transporter n=1 Tax=Paenibacillus rhizolycopersici TaxID=2780073 RepID=A0ABS2H626_9BACL|nr:EamA family transporter [Paenibacillus rhizolycopersici]MBM6995301.1 EamA family transporter [Paenibacillus rhizolycopersici]